MQGLKVLDLKDNAIATIQEGAFSELPSLEELRLNSSSLLCDCQLKWMPAWMEASEELAATADLKCGHPENLVGLAVHQVSAQNFTCGTLLSSLPAGLRYKETMIDDCI